VLAWLSGSPSARRGHAGNVVTNQCWLSCTRRGFLLLNIFSECSLWATFSKRKQIEFPQKEKKSCRRSEETDAQKNVAIRQKRRNLFVLSLVVHCSPHATWATSMKEDALHDRLKT